MPIAPGTRLGPYEVLSSLGAGGMGEVYRATDRRLGRDVAIKVLPAEVAQDADRLRRFELEARATAALNHPNILTVFDVGRETDVAGGHAPLAFVVEELLEGRTLRDVMSAGAIPMRKAVDYASQIARGLAAAHGKGIVHRDLKPENVFVTADDHVKILDFGLAKVIESTRPSSATATMSMALGTQPGFVLGTIGYMAPEQVRGQAVDHRADIFSLGVVLYELLSGQRAFSGPTTADTMMAILKEAPPDLEGSGRAIPSGLARIVERCLDKEPGARFQSASDLAFALQAVASGTRTSSGVTASIASQNAAARFPRASWGWVAAALAIGIVVGGLVARQLAPIAPPQPLAALEISAPGGYTMGERAALSSDGTELAFVVNDADRQHHLALRRLASPEVRILDNTLDGDAPFWSPDGKELGFFDRQRLRVLTLENGQVRVIADAAGARQAGTWNQRGTIVFAVETGVPLMKVDAHSKSAPVPLSAALGYRPFFLPDGRHVLFSNVTNVGTISNRKIQICDVDSGAVKDLSVEGKEPKYASGYLFYVTDTTLVARPFDPATMQVSGTDAPLGNIARHVGSTGPDFSVTASGAITYVNEPQVAAELTRITRTGVVTALDASGTWLNPRLSDDDTLVVAQHADEPLQNSDILLFDLARHTSRLLVSGQLAGARMPMWTAGNKTVLYQRVGTADVEWVQRSTDGSGDERPLATIPLRTLNITGTLLRGGVYGFALQNANRDIVYLPTLTAEPRSLFATPANETQPAVSPDERWIAYATDAEGGNQHRDIVVDRFPDGGHPKLVSGSVGGLQPVWRRDGRELFYLGNDKRLMVVSVESVGNELRIGEPAALFQTSIATEAGLGTRSSFDAARDGSWFIVAQPGARHDAPATVTVLMNWPSSLNRAK